MANIFDDFFQRKTVELYTPEENKDELFFSIDSFNKPYTVNDKKTLAQLVYNLLYLRPGTYPSSPYMGLNIRSYFFQLLSDEELVKLQDDVTVQLKTYLPTSQIKKSIVTKIKDPETGLNNLAILFMFNDVERSANDFVIYFAKDKYDSRVSTKIIY